MEGAFRMKFMGLFCEVFGSCSSEPPGVPRAALPAAGTGSLGLPKAQRPFQTAEERERGRIIQGGTHAVAIMA